METHITPYESLVPNALDLSGYCDPFRALYLHIPFCVKRCAYCDFTTCAKPADDPAIDAYMEDLALAVRHASKADALGSLKTVYIGGGTPSYVGMQRLSLLLYTLSVSMHLTPDVECTMEANPESLDERMVRDIWALGVNRLSLGVQSFNDEELASMGRAHDSQRAVDAIGLVKERFSNFSIDLIAGVPQQTARSFAASIHAAVELEVPHISIYPLTIEEGTPFAAAYKCGTLTFPDDDFAADAMELAEDILTDAGYVRYEVASYALPGHECKHNMAYWTGVPYLGLGRGATSMLQGSAGRIRVTDGAVDEMLCPQDALLEDIMLGFRLSKGPDEGLIHKAVAMVPGFEDTLDELVRLGLIQRRGVGFAPTHLGWLCGNELYGRIIG